jgi:predicted dehydrogenase
MKKISWGVLSTSNFAFRQIIPSVKKSAHSVITGIASRDLQKAEAKAKEHNIPKAYGAYEELLADKEIDAVYIPLPNHMHLEWIKKSLQAGKHVLCEKPVTLNSVEAEELIEFAKDYPELKLMEAFVYRFNPRWEKVKELLADKVIGDVKHVQSFFSYYNVKPDNIRNKPNVGGGALLDIGCYCISHSRQILDSEPLRVISNIDYDPVFKIDRLTSAIMDFGNVTASFTCATQIPFDQYSKIYGDNGRIEIHRPFNPDLDGTTKVITHSNDKFEEILFDACDHYTVEFDEFSKSILNNSDVLIPITDSLNNMKVIDGIFKSAESNDWIPL